MARFSSANLIAASTAGAHSPVSCSVRSGSPSQRIETAGNPSFQRTSISAFVVQTSCCKCADGNGPSAATMGASASPGNDLPANRVTLFWTAVTCCRFPRGDILSGLGKAPTCRRTPNFRFSKRPTVFALAIRVRPPAFCTSSGIVGTEMYFPSESSSPFSTTAGVSTSTGCFESISGRYT